MYTYECGNCGRELPRDSFHKDSSCSKGHHSICKECRSSDKNIIGNLVSNARYRSKKFDREFNLTKEYVKNLREEQNNKCALTGREMTSDPENRGNINMISIDRIHSDRGYTKENIQLVCTFANRMKGSKTNEEFIKLCKDVISHNIE